MKIIGTGFGRTGTLSLKFALEQLGFPCYHMQEAVKHPSHFKHWQAAHEGKAMNWNDIFAGYEATVDYPACLFYEEMLEAYPDAKVVHSVRDPERWHQSTLETIYHFSNLNNRLPIPFFDYVQKFTRVLVWDSFFEGRFKDKAFAITKFHEHTDAVKGHVPPEKLLVFDVKQGWEPLCDFLDVPIPDTPFPHVNDRRTMKRLFMVIQASRVVVPLVAVVLVWLGLRRFGRK